MSYRFIPWASAGGPYVSSGPGAALYNAWRAGAVAASGTFTGSSEVLAANLADALFGASYYSKIKALYPLLGGNLATARMPLIDTLTKGIATNANFVNGDFSESTGLQGNGTNKCLNLIYTPNDLNTSQRGGLGYWERSSVTTDNRMPMGANTSEYFMIISYNQVGLLEVAFYWGAGGAARANDTSSIMQAKHYYGQRISSTDRRIYKDGVLKTTSTTSNTPTGTTVPIRLMSGGDTGGAGSWWDGRCGVAYLTDGTLSDADAAALHTLLGTYLITPTGR